MIRVFLVGVASALLLAVPAGLAKMVDALLSPQTVLVPAAVTFVHCLMLLPTVSIAIVGALWLRWLKRVKESNFERFGKGVFVTAFQVGLTGMITFFLYFPGLYSRDEYAMVRSSPDHTRTAFAAVDHSTAWVEMFFGEPNPTKSTSVRVFVREGSALTMKVVAEEKVQRDSSVDLRWSEDSKGVSPVFL